MTVGSVLRIEKLSTFDGDGLRTVIFLKGCPLICQWCSTPESQPVGLTFGVRKDQCTRCMTCVEACPEKAITFDEKTGAFATDMDACSRCRACVEACPADARTAWGYEATVDAVLRELGKDTVFYYHSGGGVTVSGGEPLVQKTFVRDLLEGCVVQGIHTAVETSGHVPWDHIEAVLPWLDTLFIDIKHMDSVAHRRITGVDNHLILENLKRIDDAPRRLPVIVRMPVIPGINDQPHNIKALGLFCRGLSKLEAVELLPYHRLGMETYRSLSIDYALADLTSPDREQMAALAGILEGMGLTVRIGGGAG